MEAAIKREQSHAMHELCRALAGSMGNIKTSKKRKSRSGMGEIAFFICS
jgi:hypothetical protein